MKAHWQMEAGQGDFWIDLLVGSVFQGVLLVLPVRRVFTVLHR